MEFRRGVALALALTLGGCAGRGDAGGAMTADRARSVLTQQGYADLQNLHAVGSGFEAQAMRNGNPVTVDIDGDGIIYTK